MLSNTTKSIFLFIILLFSSSMAQADNVSGQTAQAFIRSFYANLSAPSDNPKTIENLKEYFAGPLYQLLLINQMKREKSKGGICGFMDSDPFYDTRDADKNIKYMHVAQTSGHTLVAIAFEYDAKPFLIVKLRKQNQEWKIVNFMYPNEVSERERDLITHLRMLQAENCAAV